MRNLYLITLFFLLAISFETTFAQKTNREKGIELYLQGNYPEAIYNLIAAAKLSKIDAETWNYLGLAYLNTGKTKDAQKALQKAVKLAPQNSIYRSNLGYAYLLNRKKNKAESEIEKAIQLDPQNAGAYYIRGTTFLWKHRYDEAIADADRALSIMPELFAAYVLKSDSLLHKFGKVWAETSAPREHLELLKQAISSSELCIDDCLKNDKSNVLSERKETVKAFYDYFIQKKENPEDQTASVETPLKILAKPRPSYPDSARQNGQQGTVRLGVLFAADGTIKYIIVLRGLGFGLSQVAVGAAQKIQFEPAMKDGKPISVVKQVEYSFSIY